MSRIYFHSEHGDAEVRGSERFRFAGFCNDMLVGVLGLDGFMREEDLRRFLVLFPEGHYLHRMPHLSAETIKTAVQAPTGKHYEQFFTASLNTALVMGSDSIRLAARLHGQCEIHAYVEGPDREWLAKIIERGREDGIYRAEAGWESVVALLRSRDDCPVATSFSITESFPNPAIARFEDIANPDAWYDLPEAAQWARAIAGLRASGDRRMSPGNWDAFHFNDGTTAFDLHAQLFPPLVGVAT